MLNLGVRDVFVDGTAQTIRYGSDLRIAPEYQGSRVLIYINRAVKECIQDTWYQSVILEENEKSRGALEGGRAGLPIFKPMGGIVTHTITGCKRTSPISSKRVRKATAADIPAMATWASSTVGSSAQRPTEQPPIAQQALPPAATSQPAVAPAAQPAAHGLQASTLWRDGLQAVGYQSRTTR